MPSLKVKNTKALGLKNYGKQWKKLNECVPSRTITQIKTHAQKFFIRLQRMAPKEVDSLEYLRKMPRKALTSLTKNYSDSKSLISSGKS